MFKQLQTNIFSKTTEAIVVKFHLKYDQTPGFQNYKFGLGIKNPRCPPLLKIAKPSKSTFSPEPLNIIGYKFDWNINGTLVFKIVKIKKKTHQSKVTVTYFVFTSPILLKCQYLEKMWMYFVQIWSQWSLNGTISYLCKLTIQDGCQGLLLKIAYTRKWQSLKTHWLKLIRLCARMFLV